MPKLPPGPQSAETRRGARTRAAMVEAKKRSSPRQQANRKARATNVKAKSKVGKRTRPTAPR